MKIRSADVPQAESLSAIRRVVLAIRDGAESSAALVGATGFSDRHVRYRLQAARVLGLVTSKRGVTPRAIRLLATKPGSPSEREVWRRGVRASKTIRELAPRLLSNPQVDTEAIAKRIREKSGLAHSTAERRARVLRSWHRQLSKGRG